MEGGGVRGIARCLRSVAASSAPHTIDRGSSGTEASALSGAADNTLYAIPGGALDNLSLMGGLRYVGKSYGNDTKTIRNSSRTFVDRGLSCDFANQGYAETLMQLNLRNALDRREQTHTAG